MAANGMAASQWHGAAGGAAEDDFGDSLAPFRMLTEPGPGASGLPFRQLTDPGPALRQLSRDAVDLVRRQSSTLANTPLHQSSSRLLRAASTTYAGGAAVLPPAADSVDRRLSGRTPSMRQVNQQAVQQRMVEEIWARYRIRVSVFLVTLFSFVFTMIFVFFNAMYAVLVWGSLPCDQPLNMYLLTTLTVGQISSQLVNILLRQRWAQPQRVRIALSVSGPVPGWIVIAWGLKMLLSCRTCETTNPGLFYPTRNLVYAQTIFFVLTTIFFSIGFPGVLARLMASMADNLRPGCEKAVHELPKVSEDDPELIDPEDGAIMECPICADAFRGSTVTKAIVRTDCGHHFHEQCLATWCKNHMDCPMCREPVGRPDVATAV
jgi:hypothetical protein